MTRTLSPPRLRTQVANLLEGMMAYNAAERPMPEDVLNHPWLAPPCNPLAAPFADTGMDTDTGASSQHPAPPQHQAPRAPGADHRGTLPEAPTQQEGFPADGLGGGGTASERARTVPRTVP